MNEIKSTTSKSKQKGSTFENKVAKELGLWIFNDQYMLGRHPTSGAQKHTHVGDIVPIRRIPQTFNNGEWCFLVETKIGYRAYIPNLNTQTIVRQWITKALNEVNENQNIIYLITSFHGYSPLLISDIPFNLTANLILNHIDENKKVIPFYVYEYRQLLKYTFFSLYENNTYLVKKLNKVSSSLK